jgi:hypothetical protein
LPTARLNFRRHFVLLGCAFAVIVILGRLDIFGSSALLPSTAIYGALHAIALTGALDVTATLRRKSLFILLAAALDVAALYVGIFSLGLLGAAPIGMGARAYLAFGICSISGAICYGLLIRRFWLPSLTPRPIARISLGCLVASLLALLLEQSSGMSALWGLAAAWWLAFSSGLWIFARAVSITIPAGQQRG